MPGRTRLTESEVKAALEQLPAELHRLLYWLLTGQEQVRAARNGTT